MWTRNVASLLIFAAALAISGCGDSTPTAGSAPVATASVPASAGDAADASVKALIAGLKQGRPEAFWDFLPPDFQDDLNGLIHQFAEKMDPEVWDKTVALVRKLAGVLKTQERFLTAGAIPQSQAIGRAQQKGGEAGGSADWKKLADLLETILDSDLASLDRLKSADGGKLLAIAGAKAIEQLRTLSRHTPDDDFAFNLDRLAELQVSVASATKDAARLKFDAPGDTPLIIKFVNHKGKWIPEDLEYQWQDRIGNARAWLATALNSDTMAGQKARYLEALAAADAALDKMSAAKTEREFFVAGQQTTFALMGLFQTLAAPAPPTEPPAREAPPVATKEIVTVVVDGALDDDAQDALRTKLKEAADDPDRAALELLGSDDLSVYKIGPVEDLAAYAKRLDFLEITAVNEKSRTIFTKPRK